MEASDSECVSWRVPFTSLTRISKYWLSGGRLLPAPADVTPGRARIRRSSSSSSGPRQGPSEQRVDGTAALAGEPIADDRHRHRVSAPECPAGAGPRAERVEELIVDQGHPRQPRLPCAAHREPVARVPRHPFEHREVQPPFGDHGKRRVHLDDGEPFRVRVRERPQQDAVRHGEDGGIQSRPECRRQDRGAGGPAVGQEPADGRSELRLENTQGDHGLLRRINASRLHSPPPCAAM